MKPSVFVMCMLCVLVWSGATVLAQGKGKEGGDGTTVKGRDAKPNQAQGSPQAGDVNTGKGAGKGGQTEKQGGPQGKKAGQAAEEVEKGKGKGKGSDKQGQAFQKQQRHEQAKHMERQAKLNRLREIAVKKGDAEMIARVDKLIAKEQEVYNRKLTQVQGQARAMPPMPAGGEKAGKAPAGPNDLAARKEGMAAPGQKGKAAGDAAEVKKEQKEAPAGQKREKK
jgi:hypothetical protein